MFRKFFIGMVAVILTACVFVQPTVEGKKVRELTDPEVERCQQLGKFTSSVTDRVGVVKRDAEAVREDVALNAKNNAASMGGDTIVAASALVDGRQTFFVYKCLGQ